MPLDLRDWEQTIQQMVDDFTSAQNQAGNHKNLTAWRRKLEKEPTLLQPYQIDEIVREVRRRLVSADQ
jgi:hypothetical protein